MRRLGRTWSLALFGVLFYKPLHPVQHLYLLRPLELIASVVIALPVAWVLSSRSVARPIALVAVTVVVCEALPGIPRYCSVSESLAAFAPLFHGEEPARSPLGAHKWFHPLDVNYPYRWSDYCAVLRYLRSNTGSQTFVANFLRRFPFPPVNGPTGRLSPFLAESGICWMWVVDQDLDASFAESLELATDSVVVWCPNEVAEPRLKLEQVTAVIRRSYHPEARFGRIEIWRRSTDRRADMGPAIGVSGNAYRRK
jgi:hypothetical protein